MFHSIKNTVSPKETATSFGILEKVAFCSKAEKEKIMVNEFNEYVRDCFSEAGEIVIKSMMGGFLVYFKGKLIGDICGDELFLKRTPTSDRLLADSELRYPYEGSNTLMHVFDLFDDKALIQELLEGMYAELPEKKAKKNR